MALSLFGLYSFSLAGFGGFRLLPRFRFVQSLFNHLLKLLDAFLSIPWKVTISITSKINFIFDVDVIF